MDGERRQIRETEREEERKKNEVRVFVVVGFIYKVKTYCGDAFVNVSILMGK